VKKARTAQAAEHSEHWQNERRHRRASKNAGVAACLVDPGKKVSCLLRCLVVNFRPAESAYICRYIDRLLTVGAVEDIQILRRTAKDEFI